MYKEEQSKLNKLRDKAQKIIQEIENKFKKDSKKLKDEILASGKETVYFKLNPDKMAELMDINVPVVKESINHMNGSSVEKIYKIYAKSFNPSDILLDTDIGGVSPLSVDIIKYKEPKVSSETIEKLVAIPTDHKEWKYIWDYDYRDEGGNRSYLKKQKNIVQDALIPNLKLELGDTIILKTTDSRLYSADPKIIYQIVIDKKGKISTIKKAPKYLSKSIEEMEKTICAEYAM